MVIQMDVRIYITAEKKKKDQEKWMKFQLNLRTSDPH
jgi:hypothetical protein